MQNKLERQLQIETELINSMIVSTPESWEQIVLTITRPPADDPFILGDPEQTGNFLHELSSPQGYPPVGPEVSIFEATYKLDELLRSAGGILVKAVYTATQDEGGWRFHSEYEYENTTR
jgi:hypothetical protein